MPKIARIGDTGSGICLLHDPPKPFTTTFITGDPIVDINGRPMVRVGDLGTTTCGHTTQATSGSPTVKGSNGQNVHRVGDGGIVIGGGSYTVVSGSPDTFAGD